MCTLWGGAEVPDLFGLQDSLRGTLCLMDSTSLVLLAWADEARREGELVVLAPAGAEALAQIALRILKAWDARGRPMDAAAVIRAYPRSRGAPSPPAEPAPQPIHPAAFTNAQPDVDRHLQQLGNADERVRSQTVIELGRMRAYRAADPLAATLAGDPSPVVREAAARALALIGSRQALPALQRAALADADHDVRHSAQFAVEVIQAGR